MKIHDTLNHEVKLLTAKECALLLGVTQQTISRLARKGEISSRQVANRRLFLEPDINLYMERENIISAPPDHPRRTKKVPKITALSFFSGALGLDFGFELAGIQSLLYCENDLKCRMTIEKNRPVLPLPATYVNFLAMKSFPCRSLVESGAWTLCLVAPLVRHFRLLDQDARLTMLVEMFS